MQELHPCHGTGLFSFRSSHRFNRHFHQSFRCRFWRNRSPDRTDPGKLVMQFDQPAAVKADGKNSPPPFRDLCPDNTAAQPADSSPYPAHGHVTVSRLYHQTDSRRLCCGNRRAPGTIRSARFLRFARARHPEIFVCSALAVRGCPGLSALLHHDRTFRVIFPRMRRICRRGRSGPR